jgi:hypothetical protein
MFFPRRWPVSSPLCFALFLCFFCLSAFSIRPAAALLPADGLDLVRSGLFGLDFEYGRVRPCVLAAPRALAGGQVSQVMVLGGSKNSVPSATDLKVGIFNATRSFVGPQTNALSPLDVTFTAAGSYTLPRFRAKCIGVNFPAGSAYSELVVITGDTIVSPVNQLGDAVEVVSFKFGVLSSFFVGGATPFDYGKMTEQSMVAGPDYVFLAGGLQSGIALVEHAHFFDMASQQVNFPQQPLPLPTGRMGMAGAYAGRGGTSGVLLAGGADTVSGLTATDELVFYMESDNRTFTRKTASAGTPRMFGSAANVNGQVFLVGGFDATGMNIVPEIEVVSVSSGTPVVDRSMDLGLQRSFAAFGAAAFIRDELSGGNDWHLLLFGGTESFSPGGTWNPDNAGNQSTDISTSVHAPGAQPMIDRVHAGKDILFPAGFVSVSLGPVAEQRLVFVGGGVTSNDPPDSLMAFSLVDPALFVAGTTGIVTTGSVSTGPATTATTAGAGPSFTTGTTAWPPSVPTTGAYVATTTGSVIGTTGNEVATTSVSTSVSIGGTSTGQLATSGSTTQLTLVPVTTATAARPPASNTASDSASSSSDLTIITPNPCPGSNDELRSRCKF